MLGYIVAEGRGEADRRLEELARRLTEAGVPLAGAVQVNSGTCAAGDCDMDLVILGSATRVRISQSLGAMSDGCRLDPGGLETAVGLVGATLATAPPRLLIVNKFGRQEAEGRGFRPLIGDALAEGIAVLTAVAPDYLPAFRAFAGGMEEQLPAEGDALLGWARARAGGPVTLE